MGGLFLPSQPDSPDPTKANVSDMVDNPDMSADRHNKYVTEHAAYGADTAVSAIANSKTAVRYYFNGVAQNGTPNTGDIIIWIDNTTTSGGNAAFFPTSDHTATGTALFSSIEAKSVLPFSTDSTSVYSRGVPVVAVNKKSVTIPITKQGNTGVVVLGISVLATITQPSAPDGVAINVTFAGVAA